VEIKEKSYSVFKTGPDTSTPEASHQPQEAKGSEIVSGSKLIIAKKLADVKGQVSKIVDENGEPLVVYHSGDFNENEDIPLNDMHFGTHEAAEERHTHRAIIDHILGIEAYEDEDGNWQWVDNVDDYSSEDMGLSYNTKAEALKAANQNIIDRTDEILNGILDEDPTSRKHFSQYAIQNTRWTKGRIGMTP
jgi:hypothetical protein